MEKQQVALEETLMGKRMTPRDLEATGGSSRSKQGLKLALALVAVMALLIVVLVIAFSYCFCQSGAKAACNQTQEAPPGTLMTNCTWKESDREETYDIFTADDSANYLVYGWVKLSEVTHLQLTLIHSDKNDKREVKMTADKTQTFVFVFEEMPMIKNTKLSLSVPAKLKSCTDSRFHVYAVVA